MADLAYVQQINALREGVGRSIEGFPIVKGDEMSSAFHGDSDSMTCSWISAGGAICGDHIRRILCLTRRRDKASVRRVLATEGHRRV